jgi:GNAT superfamily N-acetyltransferase
MGVNTFVLRAAGPFLPDGLRDLEREATAGGIGNVSTLISCWVDGSQRYDRPGESLLVAVDAATNEVIGVGGLSQCPHVPGALRVRRFYVAELWRRRGVANAMARELIDGGLSVTDTLTCNARASAMAPPFWESLGFRPVEAEGITHRYRR